MKQIIHRLILISIPVLFSGMLFLACNNDMEKISTFANDSIYPVERAIDVEYFYTENGILKSKMTASVLNKYEQPEIYTELLKGFKLEMYDSAGVINSTISANYAKKYDKRNLLEAKYNVIVTDHIENKNMYTEHLIYDEENDRIYSDKFVKIVQPDKIIFGDGFESDKNFTQYTIVHVKGEIMLSRSDDEEQK